MSSKLPPHLNHPDRAARASFAKHTINTVIPHILLNHPRAKAGNLSTEKIYYSPETAHDKPKESKPSRGSGRGREHSKRGKITGHFKPLNPRNEVSTSVVSGSADTSSEKQEPFISANPDNRNSGHVTGRMLDGNITPSSSTSGSVKSRPKISVVQSDTLDAAQVFVNPRIKDRKIAVLNMASFLRPGGGVINGAIAQEESLCLRSTLYTALDEKFYRLPKFGGLYTRDILVFRDSNNKDLPKSEWYYVDVISVAALKRPDLITSDDGKELYEYEQEKEEMMSKIKLILRTAVQNRVTHLILGALGCGAYHNPPEEVAKMFRRALLGDNKGRWAQDQDGIEEIVFAIFDDGVNLKVFRECLDQPQITSATTTTRHPNADSSEPVSRDVDMET